MYYAYYIYQIGYIKIYNDSPTSKSHSALTSCPRTNKHGDLEHPSTLNSEGRAPALQAANGVYCSVALTHNDAIMRTIKFIFIKNIYYQNKDRIFVINYSRKKLLGYLS